MQVPALQCSCPSTVVKSMSSPAVDIFFIDDNKTMRQSTRQWLELADYRVMDFDRAQPALDLIDKDFPGIIISDVKMPKMDGVSFQKAVSSIDPDLPVILVTAHGDIAMAVEATKNGAYDFFEKPFDPERILDTIKRAIEKRRLILENRDLRRNLNAAEGLDARLVGSSPLMRLLKREIISLAATDANILIIGETGTGKEIVAHCLHDWSARKEKAFIGVNCAAIPTSIAESEMFGHKAGAFTGAARNQRGKLEAVEGGTLFLDELIGMPLQIQSKLLRAIEERTIMRLGSNRTRPVDFRLISACNKPPASAIRDNELREDLYYRLNTVELIIPPLRERKEDIPLLFSLFLDRAAELYDRHPDLPGPAEYGDLLHYNWPGNVRELKSIAERYILTHRGKEGRLSELLANGGKPKNAAGATLLEQVRLFERHLIKDAIKRNSGDMKKVMADLGVPRRTLNEKMHRYDLNRSQFKGSLDK